MNETTFSKFAPIVVYALLPNDDDDDHDDHKDEHDEQDDQHEHHDDHDDDKDDHDKDNQHEHDHDDHDDGEEHSKEKRITQNIDVYKNILKRYETGNKRIYQIKFDNNCLNISTKL